MAPFVDRKLSRRAVLGVVGGTALGTVATATPLPPQQPGKLSLELRTDPLTARFVNAGRDPVRILKPFDGSEWCWIMPHYRLTVIDGNDREATMLPRCKLYGFPYFQTKWPDDYLVTIPAGGEFSLPVGHNHALREAGPYRVRLECLFAPKVARTAGGPYLEGLWVGSVISNTVKVRLSPRD
jgi:hypothetical protein